MSSNIVSNSGLDVPVISIVIALFILVTFYYLTLYISFKVPIKKLVVSYVIILVLLCIILLISRYYFSFFKTYESFIADYKQNKNANKLDMDMDINRNMDKKIKNNYNYTNNPFAPIYDIDDMCKDKKKENIGWKCRVRKLVQNNLDLNNISTEANKESSVSYKLKYDGIYDVKDGFN